jgi:glycosyltransferase involved in cell wall biosynthesis/spore maturation protein CgeB
MSPNDNAAGFKYSELAASERNALLHLEIRDLERERASLEGRLRDTEEHLRSTSARHESIFSELRTDRDALLTALSKLRGRLHDSHRRLPAEKVAGTPAVPHRWRQPSCADVSGLRVAAIMDEFTRKAFDQACELVPLSLQGWMAEIETARPDLLLVESAWEGNDGAWHDKVNHLSPELILLVNWCRNRNIPTVFWNKEDPVHYNSFESTASIFDFVFTTDFESVQRYKNSMNHGNIYVLPFFCEPNLHNPVQTIPRRGGFSFAGTYYARYSERQKNFETIINATSAIGETVIYDRKFGGSDPAFAFPTEYHSFILGSLPFAEVDKSYKGFEFGINLNSVKQSQTMYARRVFDLLVSNTHVVSNYSRGLRLMFGDLVVSSDDYSEIQRRVRSLVGPQDTPQTTPVAAHFRLLALRKVLLEHTTANRLEYIAEKVWGERVARHLPWVRVVGFADSNESLYRLLKAFRAQSWTRKRMTIVVSADVGGPRMPRDEGLEVIRESDAKRDIAALISEECVAYFSPKDAYGADYITDLTLAFLYSDAEHVGKSTQPTVGVHDRSVEYSWVTSVPVRSSMSLVASLHGETLLEWLRDGDTGVVAGDKVLLVDSFNYAADAPEEAAVFEPGFDIDTGLPMRSIQAAAESILPLAPTADKVEGLYGQDLWTLFSKARKDKLLTVKSVSGGIEVRSELAAKKHAYVYAGEQIPIERFVLEADSLTVHAVSSTGLKLSIVVVFFDKDANRLVHSVLSPGKNHHVPVPEGAASILLGIRGQGSGSCTLSGIAFETVEPQPAMIPRMVRSRNLILTNVYPSSQALYRNGFVHSRVKGYQEAGVHSEVFCLNARATPHSYEFEGVDVHVGRGTDLRQFLESGQVEHILVHFLDREMWEVVADFAKTTRITVWIHGAEVQPWYRRDFNYANEEERDTAKISSDGRMNLWREVFADVHPNVHFVFVSQYFADEVMEDLGVSLSPQSYSIVHNFIDTQLFDYREKRPEQRFKLLSIRPFASRKYANDLTVEAIKILSREDFFEDLDIRIIGDGPLFDEVLSPLMDFPNVTIERRFLSRGEIADIHKDYGIFLTPTRMDSQGVSRDEAMSSGLVPVTTAVTAIPEFVDSTCGILADAEDPQGMAAGVVRLIQDPGLFAKMSAAAAARVRRQSGYDQTIGSELRMLR